MGRENGFNGGRDVEKGEIYSLCESPPLIQGRQQPNCGIWAEIASFYRQIRVAARLFATLLYKKGTVEKPQRAQHF